MPATDGDRAKAYNIVEIVDRHGLRRVREDKIVAHMRRRPLKPIERIIPSRWAIIAERRSEVAARPIMLLRRGRGFPGQKEQSRGEPDHNPESCHLALREYCIPPPAPPRWCDCFREQSRCKRQGEA